MTTLPAMTTTALGRARGADGGHPAVRGGLDRDDREARRTRRTRRYRRNTYLFHQGDDSPEVFFLVRAGWRSARILETGHRQLHTTLDRPQFFGELGVLGGMPRTAAALALEESNVWVVPAPAFLEFLSEEPTASRSLLRALARQVQSHEAFVEDLLYLDLKGRVAKRLLQLVSPSLDELPAGRCRRCPSIVTHADLASLCGGSRENVTQDPVRLPAPGLRRARRQAVRPAEDLRARQARRVVSR